MRLNKKTIALLGITFVIFVSLIYFYLLPVANTIYTDMKAYETRVAYRDNYKLHTTSLPKSVVEDICLKLGIESSIENCKSNAVVYAPELFDEIKTYFKDMPDQDKTYGTVQDKLGTYLVSCEKPDPDGYYRCRYDLRGDKVYPIFFLFDKDNFYYEIIANIGGS